MTGRMPDLAAARAAGQTRGIVSICTAHPVVIEAALVHGRDRGAPVLIEATCNQVNQEGGYTGLGPAAFRGLVEDVAARVGFDPARLILGGDHLGPNPWKHVAPEAAMERAAALVDAYARAGFTKLHLDASMGCAGEPQALPDGVVAARAARLAAVAERAARDEGAAPPCYVIGTEVPVPGGAHEALASIDVTTPARARATVEAHRLAFAEAGIAGAFARASALVVQPGVEFGNDAVVRYDRAAARDLSALLPDLPGVVFEAHSTDYQPADALRALVEDGFAILKVGPALTFALREALYGLDHIAQALAPVPDAETLGPTLERLMLDGPAHWRPYCEGDADALRVQRHFGLSDRIRYYWAHPAARAAVDRLAARLRDLRIPAPLVSQYLAALHPAVMAGRLEPTFAALRTAAVTRVLDTYAAAVRGESPDDPGSADPLAWPQKQAVPGQSIGWVATRP